MPASFHYHIVWVAYLHFKLPHIKNIFHAYSGGKQIGVVKMNFLPNA
jgi:hypothetical protein